MLCELASRRPENKECYQTTPDHVKSRLKILEQRRTNKHRSVYRKGLVKPEALQEVSSLLRTHTPDDPPKLASLKSLQKDRHL